MPMLTEDGRQYHAHLREGDVGRYVLLPGDPGRTDKIAELFDNPKLVAHNREIKTWTGTLNGVKVSVSSTGMGCPSTAITVEELIKAGADTFIRVGTSGRVSERAQDPALQGVITTGAVRDEGTTISYVPMEYPAIADRHIVAALARAAENLGHNFAEGITHSKDSLYGEVAIDTLPNKEYARQRLNAWEDADVMCSEMEAAAIFIISSIRGCRASGIMSYKDTHLQATMETAVEALRILIEEDKEK